MNSNQIDNQKRKDGSVLVYDFYPEIVKMAEAGW